MGRSPPSAPLMACLKQVQRALKLASASQLQAAAGWLMSVLVMSTPFLRRLVKEGGPLSGWKTSARQESLENGCALSVMRKLVPATSWYLTSCTFLCCRKGYLRRRALQTERQSASLGVSSGRNPPSWLVETATALFGWSQLQTEKASPFTWMVITIWSSKMNLKQSMELPQPSRREQVLAVQFWCICRVGNSLKTQFSTVSWLITQQSCVSEVKVRTAEERFTVRCTSSTLILPVKSRKKSRQSLVLSCCTLLSRAGASSGRLPTTVCLLRNQRRLVGLAGAGPKENSVILQKQSTRASARQSVVLAKGLQQVRAQMQPQVVAWVISCPTSLILSRRLAAYFCLRKQSSSSYRLSGPLSVYRSRFDDGAAEDAPTEHAYPFSEQPAPHCAQRLLESCEVQPGMGARQKPKLSCCPAAQAVQRPLSCAGERQRAAAGAASSRRAASSRMEIWMFIRLYNGLPVQEHFRILSKIILSASRPRPQRAAPRVRIRALPSQANIRFQNPAAVLALLGRWRLDVISVFGLNEAGMSGWRGMSDGGECVIQSMFLIVHEDKPIFEMELSQQEMSVKEYFLVHAALDNVDLAIRARKDYFLGQVKSDDLTLYAFVNAVQIKFILMLGQKKEIDKGLERYIKDFFTKVNEALAVSLLNPLYHPRQYLRSPTFEEKVKSAAKENLRTVLTDKKK